MVEKQVMKKRTFYIPEDLMSRLENYSNKVGLSNSDIVRVSITNYLRAHPLSIKEEK